MKISITSEEDAAPSDVARIRASLRRFNERYLGESRETPLRIFARDDNGEIVGGLIGHHRWQWMYVDLLWVHESARGRGVGGRLLDRAESIARGAGCIHATLETFSFQARPFYEKRGYVVYAELDDFPPGYGQFFMRKDLRPPAPGPGD